MGLGRCGGDAREKRRRCGRFGRDSDGRFGVKSTKGPRLRRRWQCAYRRAGDVDGGGSIFVFLVVKKYGLAWKRGRVGQWFLQSERASRRSKFICEDREAGRGAWITPEGGSARGRGSQMNLLLRCGGKFAPCGHAEGEGGAGLELDVVALDADGVELARGVAEVVAMWRQSTAKAWHGGHLEPTS